MQISNNNRFDFHFDTNEIEKIQEVNKLISEVVKVLEDNNCDYIKTSWDDYYSIKQLKILNTDLVELTRAWEIGRHDSTRTDN